MSRRWHSRRRCSTTPAGQRACPSPSKKRTPALARARRPRTGAFDHQDIAWSLVAGIALVRGNQELRLIQTDAKIFELPETGDAVSLNYAFMVEQIGRLVDPDA